MYTAHSPRNVANMASDSIGNPSAKIGRLTMKMV
jgi:hypothetical protein